MKNWTCICGTRITVQNDALIIRAVNNHWQAQHPNGVKEPLPDKCPECGYGKHTVLYWDWPGLPGVLLHYDTDGRYTGWKGVGGGSELVPCKEQMERIKDSGYAVYPMAKIIEEDGPYRSSETFEGGAPDEAGKLTEVWDCDGDCWRLDQDPFVDADTWRAGGLKPRTYRELMNEYGPLFTTEKASLAFMKGLENG